MEVRNLRVKPLELSTFRVKPRPRPFFSGRTSRQGHRIRIHRRATRVGAFEVFEAAHVALRTLLAFSQPVNCIFWPIGMLNWLVAASKLHKHRVTCCTAEWPFYVFLFYAKGLTRPTKHDLDHSG